jgi:sugar phosphate isomerase/epimerase
MKITRRNMLQLTGAGMAVAGLPLSGWATCGTCGKGAHKKHIPIALQLYSVRGDCRKDFDNALAQVAKMGYEGVEFAGYYKYGDDAAGLKKKLDELGLKAPATHIRAGAFEGDRLKKTIEFHKTIGCTFLIIPGDGRFCQPEGNKQLAEFLNKTAETLKKEGMYCGYHNHSGEFRKHDGKTYYDWFAERTTKDVVLQQDVGWTSHAGQDPVAYIRKYPGRMKIMHMKAYTKDGTQPIIGQDSQDWKAIVAAAIEVGGIEWFTIEQEKTLPGKSPMECSAMSLKGLQAVLAD